MFRKTLAVLALLSFPLPALACGPDDDCLVETGNYRISMPEAAPRGALVFAHGYRGSSRGVMRNMALRRLADEYGFALVAINSVSGSWNLRYSPGKTFSEGRDEMAYVDAVLDDVIAKYGVPAGNVYATGFSEGGMMTWTLLCERGSRFAGFAPMSGTFWTPEPAECASAPADVVHIHGTADPTVPITGRQIGQSKQGNLNTVLAMYRAHGDYRDAGRETLDTMTCEFARNPEGRRLDLCLFDGGHSFSVARLRQALDWLTQG
ncbi:alpha/beta hydrolase family esterase [Actibacterium mucosum]|uniref:alpha/beta hydrolase family esterase n=1 Tax=Actibacterium mucosum TaxID=1087332 RepID=UPI0005560878|nr:PHB depolymerase family esterase [Actibacterium mucosum]